MNKQKMPRLVTVAIITTITIVFWVFTGLYEVITLRPPLDVDSEILKPIDPNLNFNALNKLEGRIYFNEGETTSPVIVKQQNASSTLIEVDEKQQTGTNDNEGSSVINE